MHSVVGHNFETGYQHCLAILLVALKCHSLMHTRILEKFDRCGPSRYHFHKQLARYLV
jgi:hypothetical protein